MGGGGAGATVGEDSGGAPSAAACAGGGAGLSDYEQQRSLRSEENEAMLRALGLASNGPHPGAKRYDAPYRHKNGRVPDVQRVCEVDALVMGAAARVVRAHLPETYDAMWAPVLAAPVSALTCVYPTPAQQQGRAADGLLRREWDVRDALPPPPPEEASASAVRVADAAVAAVATACSKLAWLDLSGATITDQSMHTIANRWPKLGRLELRGVRGVTATALSGLATHLPHMHTLFLWGCSGLNDASVQSIATHCTQLHTLCIGGRAPRHSGTGAGAPTHPGTRAASTHAPPLPPPRRPGHPHPHPGHNPNQARAPSPTAPSSPSRGASARGSRSSAWASASGLRTPPWRRSPSQNVGCR